MPASYTYTHIATNAMLKSGQLAHHIPAFYAGANGPNPLFMYAAFHRKNVPYLRKLAGQIRRDNPGIFLLELVKTAKTPLQQSFATGFLAHYAANYTLNPYITALEGKGRYEGKKNRPYFESCIDATLYYSLYKTDVVPPVAGTPVLVADDLAQVASTMQQAVLSSYQADVPTVVLADAYHDNMSVRRLMNGNVFNRLWLRFLSLFGAGGTMVRDLMRRTQHATVLKNLPPSWVNPNTGETIELTFDDMIELAESESAALIEAASSYWMGQLNDDELLAIIGNKDYYTGLEKDVAVAPVKPTPPPEEKPAHTPPAPLEKQPAAITAAAAARVESPAVPKEEVLKPQRQPEKSGDEPPAHKARKVYTTLPPGARRGKEPAAQPMKIDPTPPVSPLKQKPATTDKPDHLVEYKVYRPQEAAETPPQPTATPAAKAPAQPGEIPAAKPAPQKKKPAGFVSLSQLGKEDKPPVALSDTPQSPQTAAPSKAATPQKTAAGTPHVPVKKEADAAPEEDRYTAVFQADDSAKDIEIKQDSPPAGKERDLDELLAWASRKPDYLKDPAQPNNQ